MAYELINSALATPHRMHAMIRLLARADSWERSQVLDLVEPKPLDSSQDVAKVVLGALRNMDLVEVAGDVVGLQRWARNLVDIELFRQYLVSSVVKARNENHPNYRFGLFTAWYATRNEEVLTADNRALVEMFSDQIPFEGDDRVMNTTKFNGWRPLAAFLGYGWPYSGKVVPDATVRVRPEIGAVLPEDGEVPFAEFITKLSTRCPELDNGDLFRLAWSHSRPEQPGNRLSLMLSNALRRLDGEGTIVLSRIPDAGDTWQLYPASGFSLREVTHVKRGARA